LKYTIFAVLYEVNDVSYFYTSNVVSNFKVIYTFVESVRNFYCNKFSPIKNFGDAEIFYD
jgi:hypothetical protein